MKIREVKESDFLKIHELAKTCRPLEAYPAHIYKIIFRYFKKICLVAEEKKQIIGFITGLISGDSQDICFAWQVGVNPKIQAKGLGSKLLAAFEDKVRERGCCRIELTVDPKNIPSRKLFEKFGYTNISRKEKNSLEIDGVQVGKDFYGPGRHFVIYEKDL